LKTERKLKALARCGVDNWEGYDDVRELFGGDEEEDEEEEDECRYISILKGRAMKIFEKEGFLK